MLKNKVLIISLLTCLSIFLGIGIYLIKQEKSVPNFSNTKYIFDKAKYCPDYGDCQDFGLESRKCNNVGDCLTSCSYGCVSKKWMEGRIDCETMWANFNCECKENICQRL